MGWYREGGKEGSFSLARVGSCDISEVRGDKDFFCTTKSGELGGVFSSLSLPSPPSSFTCNHDNLSRLSPPPFSLSFLPSLSSYPEEPFPPSMSFQSSPKNTESADPTAHIQSTSDGSSVDDDALVEKKFGLKNEFVR